MKIPDTFNVSSFLKDIIGKDLITDDFVAVFELVKNSIDAGATKIEVVFDDSNNHDSAKIVVSDDGKGMSKDDIREKWLWVAYSAKADGTEDNTPSTYRDKLKPSRYAGSKGVGRFSCDRLGSVLDVYSQSFSGTPAQHLSVDWNHFEHNAKQRFEDIGVELRDIDQIPSLPHVCSPINSGTVLVISNLRHRWNKDKVEKLRNHLAKLVNPFEPTPSVEIITIVTGEGNEEVNGPVGNDVADLLNTKTTRIDLDIQEGIVTTKLTDRGKDIYEIREACEYDQLGVAKIRMRIYYLNQKAKNNFTRRMGIRPIEFGHVFLYVRGFRIFPIGEETDDFFGLGRRKQQGTSRYLGPRDVIGKVEVDAPSTMFRETSSRNGGLIRDSSVDQLREAVIILAIRRLERYVVGVTWKDKLDKHREDASGLQSNEARGRVIDVLKSLIGSKDIEMVSFNHEFLDVTGDFPTGFEEAMQGLSIIAEQTGDEGLLQNIEKARKRFEQARKTEQEARLAAEAEAEARNFAEHRASTAESRAVKAEAYAERIEAEAQQLSATADVDLVTLEKFHHQATIYANAVDGNLCLALEALNEMMKKIEDPNASSETIVSDQIEEIESSLSEAVFFNKRIRNVTKVAVRALFNLERDKTVVNIVKYFHDYIEEVTSRFRGKGFAKFDSQDVEWNCQFRPLDIALVIDNLVDNALKARAKHIQFVCRARGPTTHADVIVSDDGIGINEDVVDPARIFDRGYSGPGRGTGLGLFHARRAMQLMDGGLDLDPDRESGEARFIITLPKKITEKKDET